MMEKDYVYSVLIKRGYNDHTALLVAEDLLQLNEPLNEYLLCWLDDETYKKDYAIHGYSISQLQNERMMNYPAALLTMDWLIREPGKAIESLKKKIK